MLTARAASRRGRLARGVVGFLFAAIASSVLTGVLLANAQGNPAADAAVEQLRVHFSRPTAMPVPSDNLLTAQKVSLGRSLFHDPRLSSNGKVACASCHDPKLAFRDDVVKSVGVTGQPLARHTPALWNLAWSPLLFWDGRARSLEEQARSPIEHRDEMGNSLSIVARRLAKVPSYQKAFQDAFPKSPRVSSTTILKAIASFERTLVSPLTRFDAWVSGDDMALTTLERRGFRLFAGKARCAGCHFSFAFSDRAFHDIGLPTDDLGRGAVLGLPGLNHAFKTPGLRELVWTAPYMHDGSLATLDAVIRHYVAGVNQRPTLAHELRRPLRLSQSDRAALIAFLKTLSSATLPKPAGGKFVR